MRSHIALPIYSPTSSGVGSCDIAHTSPSLPSMEIKQKHYTLTLFQFLIPLLLLAGCTSNLQELKTISPVADNFSSSLAAEYLAYAESEAEQGLTSSSEHFASKGVRASKGELVEPDTVNANNENYKDISAARLALIDVLNDDVKRVAPQKAARAQILFDCWNEQEGNKSLVTGASCAAEFSSQYDELQLVADNLVHGADSKNTLEFYEGSAELDADAKYIIAKMTVHLVGHDDYMLGLKAYYNSKDKKNRKGRLAYKRLSAVRDELLKAGVTMDKIFFTKPDSTESSGSAVYLSNDEDKQNRNIVDIIVTSKHHILKASPND